MKQAKYLLLLGIFSLLLGLTTGCGNGNDPEPPAPPAENPDSIPTEFTGWENLATDSMRTDMTGGLWPMFKPSISIVDDKGNNLLSPRTEGNVRGDGFYFTHNDIICPACTGNAPPISASFSYPEWFGEVPVDYMVIATMQYCDYVDAQYLPVNVDESVMFHWPERNFKMHLRLYLASEPYTHHTEDDNYSALAFRARFGMFVNGRCSGTAVRLRLRPDGSVEIE